MSNAVWWRDKIRTNVARDRRVDLALEDEGWLVVRVWEHEDISSAVLRIEEALDGQRGDRSE